MQVYRESEYIILEMLKSILVLMAVLCLTAAWTNTPTMIIARIAEKDLEASGELRYSTL
jgi:hypothetical protein